MDVTGKINGNVIYKVAIEQTVLQILSYKSFCKYLHHNSNKKNK